MAMKQPAIIPVKFIKKKPNSEMRDIGIWIDII